MKTSQVTKYIVLAVAASCAGAGVAQAGKGANTNACVNLAVAPISPVTFNFTPVSTNCMNDTGSPASVTASIAGITCASVGYVEAQGSGWCAFESSTWNLSYAATGTPWSGSTQSTWATGSGITLSNYSPQTSVNTSPAAGTATSVDWNNQGPIYVIFTPGATSTSATPAPLSVISGYLNGRKRLTDQYVKDLVALDEANVEHLKTLDSTKLADLEANNVAYVKAVAELHDKYMTAERALLPAAKP